MKTEHILLAKDDENDALLVKRALETAGINANLQVVRDGQEAVDYLSGVMPYADRQKHPFPKLMLLDLRMPRLDGFQVLDIVRKDLRCTLPVIVLTQSENPADIRRAYELGATSYFRKPDSLESLDEMIHVLHAYWLKFNHFPD